MNENKWLGRNNRKEVSFPIIRIYNNYSLCILLDFLNRARSNGIFIGNVNTKRLIVFLLSPLYSVSFLLSFHGSEKT